MYVREVKGETLDFAHSGKLVDQSFIFYDRQTDGLWVQATGTCIRGTHKGQRLRTIPVTHTTWGEWRRLHPDTLVLAKPPERKDRYSQDRGHMDYFAEHGVKLGLGVFLPGHERLYPFDLFEYQPVINDVVHGQHVLVVFHRPTRTGMAFDPVVEGHAMHFELVNMDESEVWLRDVSSGLVCSGLTGELRAATEGEHKLRRFRTTQFKVANWLLHFPNGSIYEAP